MIELRGITYRHREASSAVFENFSLTVGKGEFACIAGPTGSGKSTLLRLLTGELHPHSGEVIVNNISVNRLGVRQLAQYRRSIGCVLADVPILEEMTTAENVRFSLELHHRYSAAELRSRVGSVLEQCGLAGKEWVLPRFLSVGERERLLIARALVRQPLILLADNAASQLDERSAAEFYRLLADEHLRGMTIVATFNDTHGFRFVPASAKRYLLERSQAAEFLPESNGAIAA